MSRSTRETRLRGVAALLLAGLAGVALVPSLVTSGGELASSAALTRALHGSGRGEATVRYSMPGMTDTPRTVRATLALEFPAQARLDVAATGECIVVRGDGGEWLQPAARQVVRFAPRQAAPALRWWAVLLGREPAARERRLGPRHYEVVLPASGANDADSAEVRLDGRGLPAELTAGGMSFRLTGWRFVRARGAAAFRLAAPAGYETVDMP